MLSPAGTLHATAGFPQGLHRYFARAISWRPRYFARAISWRPGLFPGGPDILQGLFPGGPDILQGLYPRGPDILQGLFPGSQDIVQGQFLEGQAISCARSCAIWFCCVWGCHRKNTLWNVVWKYGGFFFCATHTTTTTCQNRDILKAKILCTIVQGQVYCESFVSGSGLLLAVWMQSLLLEWLRQESHWLRGSHSVLTLGGAVQF